MAPLCTQAEECTLFWSIHGTGLVTCEPLILKCGFMLESLGCFIIKANNIGIVIGMAYVLGTRTKICQGGSNIQSRLWTAAAAAESLQSCPTLCESIDGSPPGSPVPGILQAEHWSGLPFPSPTHESEKWKGSCSVVSYPQRPHGLQPTRLLRPWRFPGKSTGVGCHCLIRVNHCSSLK